MTRVTLSEVCEFVQGGRLKLTGKDFVKEGHPAYGAGGINGYLTTAEFDKDAIVLSAIGARCGKCFYATGSWTSLANTRVIFPDQSRVDPKFLYYQLDDEARWPRSGTAQPFIRPSDVAAHEVFLPPLAEQKRIVNILDEAFADISAAMESVERAITQAGELRLSCGEMLLASHSAEAEEITLEEALERGFITSHLDGNHGGFYPRAEEFVESGVPYISANCISGDRIDLSRAKYLTPERAAVMRKGIARSGDVIFAHNATVGPVAILRTEEPKVILSTSVTYYRCNPSQVSAEYLKHFMRSRRFVSQYEAVMRQSTRNQVPITTQRRFKFTFPPVEFQDAIASTLEGVEIATAEIASVASRKLALLTELKQSLLARAFSGELTREPIAA